MVKKDLAEDKIAVPELTTIPQYCMSRDHSRFFVFNKNSPILYKVQFLVKPKLVVFNVGDNSKGDDYTAIVIVLL